MDAKGRMVSASSAYQLPPRFNRLLAGNISEMASKAAMDKQGSPVSSQFVLNLVLKTTRRDDGNCDAQFQYVSSQPLPPGIGDGRSSTVVAWHFWT